LPPFIIQKERGEEWNVIGRQAGSAVDDRVMLTAAGRECCRRSNDAHGRRPQVLSAIGIMITAAGAAGSAVDNRVISRP
jgi:hypothetical protein